jgi:predicted esterase
MAELTTEFNFRGRYFKIGEINESTKAVWFVLHGYGQLAKYFSAKFRILEDLGVCVIAPEGLSNYYLEDAQSRSRSGSTRVGASWMTRENRLLDIENYITYLNSIFKKEINTRTIPVTILGFSQGAATASRWALTNAIHFNRLILWAGIFPTDMDFEKGREVFKTKDVKIVYGNQDEFLNDSRFAEMKTLSDKLEIASHTIVFEGKHELHEATLVSLAKASG